MCRYLRSILVGPAIAAVLCAEPPLIAAPHDGPHGEGPTDEVFKVGKNGEVKIKRDVRIGEALLKKRKYLLQHELEGEDHVFVFTEIKKAKKSETSEPAVVRIKSKNALRGGGAVRSVIVAKEDKDHMYTVVNIGIAGENTEHTF